MKRPTPTVGVALLLAVCVPAFAPAPTPALAQAPSGHPGAPFTDLGGVTATVAAQTSTRARRGVLGGVIGAVAGAAVCTIISNAFVNEGSGFSTCTAKGYLLFAGGGFALGFAVGWF